MRGLAVCVLVVACYHEPASAPPAQNAAPRGQPTARYAAQLADPLGFLPIDSELVLALDGRLVRNSALWQHYAPNLLARLGPRFDTLKQDCDFDPIASITQASFGVRGLGAEHPTSVLVIHGIERSKVVACIAKRPVARRRIIVQGDTYVLPGEGKDEDIALRFVGERTMVLLGGAGADQRALQAVLDAGSPLRTSPAFTALFEHVDTHQALWFVMNGNAKVFDKLTSLGFRPRAGYAWLGLTDGLALTVHLVLPSAADAQQAATTFQPQVGMAKALVDTIDLVADDADLVFTVAMSQTKLDALIQMMGAAMP